jgi:hypothetical protein
MKAVLAALGAARYPPFSAQTRSIERFNHGWQQIQDWVFLLKVAAAFARFEWLLVVMARAAAPG